jgi:hypothetical protein
MILKGPFLIGMRIPGSLEGLSYKDKGAKLPQS